MAQGLRILLPSIVNPATDRNGAATVTRGVLSMLEAPPLNARVTCLPALDGPVGAQRIRQALSLARSTLAEKPAKHFYLYSRRLADQTNRLLESGEFDLLLLNGGDLLGLLETAPASLPKGLIAHNIEHNLYAAQIDGLGIPAWAKRRLHRDQRRLRDFELDGFRQCGAVLFLSARDEVYGRSHAPGIRTTSIPPTFNYQPAARVRKPAGRSLHLGFLAGFSWWPNREAACWFIEQVLPQTPDVHLHLFGNQSDSFPLRHPRLTAHGFTHDLDLVWETCDLMVCPVVSGGGVSVKFAEGIYNGMPTLATSFAAAGLDLADDPAVKVLDSPLEWAAFLSSAEAREFVHLRPSESLIRTFAVEQHKPRLHHFVRSLLSPESSITRKTTQATP